MLPPTTQSPQVPYRLARAETVNGLSQRACRADEQPISYLMHKALSQPEIISLAAGFVDPHTLPVEATRAAAQCVLANPARAMEALQYGTTAGYAPLRAAILQRLRAADGNPESLLSLTTDQVLITAGSNELLHLLGDTLLDPGDVVLCAAPTYFVYLGVIHSLGAKAHGIATDSAGMIPEALEETLSAAARNGSLPRIKALYVTPDFDNPAATTLAAERRGQLVEIVRRWSRQQRIYIIEDSAYRELRYWGEDLPSLRSYDPNGETVIVAGTFSKCFSPGLRIGYGILPRELLAPLLAQKGNINFGSPNFSQFVLHEAIEQGLLDEQITRLRNGYRPKLEAMLAALEKHMRSLPGTSWCRPEGGLYVWLTLPESVAAGADSPLFQRALEQGVLYVPGEFCYPEEGEPVAANKIRLSFGSQGIERIDAGIAALAKAVGASL